MPSPSASTPADLPADRAAAARAWRQPLAVCSGGLAVAALVLVGTQLASQWPLNAASAGVVAAAAMLLLAWAGRVLARSAGAPQAPLEIRDRLDRFDAPTLLLQRRGEGWEVIDGNAPARAAGLPGPGTAGVQWLLDSDGSLKANADPSAADVSETESFAYTVSHDLRAPIRVIEGFTRIVREDYGQVLDRIGNDHLDRVLGAAARMNSMIDALLALARLSSQPLACQRVDLSRMAQFVLDDLQKHAPQRRVETRVMPGLEVAGDPTLLRLVLENLLGNAYKYSSRREVAHIEFGAEQRDGRQVFYVSDDGAGFDMRFADRLFGAFQRLHSASEFQGTGVGLASVRRIVRRHGGDIWAEAEVDKGATFYFTLSG